MEEGLHYHNTHNLEDCLFCGNKLTRERCDQLEEVFDNSWSNALKALEDATSLGQQHQLEMRELYRAIPNDATIMPDEREDYAEQRQALEAGLTEIGLCIGELIKSLDLKVNNPTKKVPITGRLVEFNPDGWESQYDAIEQLVSAIVKKHNKAFEDFSKLQQAAFSKIESHVLATNQAEWSRLQKAVVDADTSFDKSISEEKTITERQLELKNDLQDHGVGADKLNELVWAYLGHKEFRLVAEEGGYKIFRPNGTAATELSEGERTALAFCYFLTQLGAEGRKLENLVLVIDDPISSLDTAARTYAYSLMTRMTKKCAQVVILTHNTSFMNMVKREFQNLQRRDSTKCVAALLALDCRCNGDGEDRTTTLTPMHDLLVKYDSEYHYLFHLVHDAADKKETEYLYLLPNATRKLLEMFSTFCSPGQSNFAGALMDHSDAVKGKVDVKALERLVQIESHGTIDGLGNLPDLTLEEALRAADAAMKFINEVAKNHYKKMCSACAS